jgi:glyoxylase-like metal-dependent hydrolase (beta-lactamase superfamily II)
VTEPQAVAESVVEVVPGVWHWNVDNEQIGGYISSSHAIATAAGTVLVDPLRLAPDALHDLGEVVAIVLTASVHQRSAWRYRRELGVPVWVPAATQAAEEEPDHPYSEGDLLPGALDALFLPGAGTTQHALLFDRIAIVADNVVRPRGGELMLMSPEWAHDPEQNRESVRRLLERDFDVLCLGHGEPVTEDAKTALAALLDAV